MTWLYSLSRAVIAPVFTVAFRMRFVGQEHIPVHGGFVLVSNHGSYLDPLFLGSAIPDPIHYLAKRELFKGTIRKWYFTSSGQIPVDRADPGTEPLQSAVDALHEGKVVGMFPEGTVTMDGRMLTRFKTGAVRLALLARVPLLPVALSGNFQVLPKPRKYPTYHRVHVRIGKPYSLEGYYGDLPDGDTLHRLTHELMGRIAKLRAHDHLLLGIEDPPEMAGGVDLPSAHHRR